MKGFVSAGLIRDPQAAMSTLFGVDVLAITPTRVPQLGNSGITGVRHLVNPTLDVAFNTPEGVKKTHLRVFSRNGAILAERCQSDAERAGAREVLNALRDQVAEYLFGAWDGTEPGKGRVHRHLEEGMTLEETATDIFGYLEDIGVVDSAQEHLSSWLDGHYEDGDPHGDVRPNGSTRAESRAYRLTTVLSTAVQARGYWPIGQGRTNENEGPFGPDRYVRGLIGETITEGTRTLPDGSTRQDVEFLTESRVIRGEEFARAPVLRGDAPQGDVLYLLALRHKLLSGGGRRDEEVPGLSEAVVWYVQTIGDLQGTLQELYEASGAKDTMSLADWVEYRPSQERRQPAQQAAPLPERLADIDLA